MTVALFAVLILPACVSKQGASARDAKRERVSSHPATVARPVSASVTVPESTTNVASSPVSRTPVPPIAEEDEDGAEGGEQIIYDTRTGKFAGKRTLPLGSEAYLNADQAEFKGVLPQTLRSAVQCKERACDVVAARESGSLLAMPYFEMHGALTHPGAAQLGVHLWAEVCDGLRSTRSEASIIVMDRGNFVTAVPVPKWLSPRSVLDVDGDGVAEVIVHIQPPGADPLFSEGRVGIASLRDGQFSVVFEGQYSEKGVCVRTGAHVTALVLRVRRSAGKQLLAHEAEYQTTCVKDNLLARSNWVVLHEREQPVDLSGQGKP